MVGFVAEIVKLYNDQHQWPSMAIVAYRGENVRSSSRAVSANSFNGSIPTPFFRGDELLNLRLVAHEASPYAFDAATMKSAYRSVRIILNRANSGNLQIGKSARYRQHLRCSPVKSVWNGSLQSISKPPERLIDSPVI